ncbi:hypothetical protein CONLIGDRAFT_699566 [Coniochaeta ligniaria NRRL 30616]|uniref:Gylcosyl hydrolase 115 C-terminal domain-containing protein n=1 Tax=Coniochaeta ligniaria NRRL 30616 TaxID=1408157 RepID=A0A1J7IZU0_9PEZI|nr:hypothetical protein CONLIGDRAFT_699566 [Coniochaeta ligniaria NRRL 30616]
MRRTLVFSFDDGGGLKLAAPGVTPEIRVAPNDYPGVIRVANDLAADFGRVLGTNATVLSTDWNTTASKKSSNPVIIVGTIGKSTLIDGLVSNKRLDVSSITGKWEAFITQVVSAPWEGQDAIFVIAGSDMRGSVFGAYDVSEQIGVSPWLYWLDTPPKKCRYVWAQSTPYVEGPPSVKFRGIFLNDEDPALTGWGHANFKNSQYGSAFGSDFYKRIFELVLRMKGNYLWPAMWSSMFYLDDAQNGPLASDWGIFMGTSHHEPMARADKEQGRFLKGSWDWKSNKAGCQAFMKDGVVRAKNWATMYTLGMRGSGDAASATLTSQALEEVIHWQQATLKDVLGKDLSDIPQQWVMYKEVPGYWANGMNVSDDVTLLWSDDNRGNIRRIPLGTETDRRGGSGMYYHFDYVGDPRNYKWINTIQLQKTWEQMSLAYDRGVQNIWIANVGDLKALELPTAHFMAMARDMSKFGDPSSTSTWLKSWSAQQFGDDVADDAASIMTTYGKLTARRKYEDLSMTPFAFNTVNYDEAELNFAEWTALADRAQAAYDKLSTTIQPTFFQAVLHPVIAGKNVFEIYTKAALLTKYINQHRVSANQLAKDVQSAFAADKSLKTRWDSLLNGKWKHFMDQTHLGYNNWQQPNSDSIPKVSGVSSSSQTQAAAGIMGVAIQDSDKFFPTASTLTLGTLTPFIPPDRKTWLDVFARDNGTFTYKITSNATYLSVSDPQQTILAPGSKTDIRHFISVNWTTAPSGSSTAALTVTAPSSTATILVPLSNPSLPPGFQGHIESTGAVSIEATHFSPSSSPTYVSIPDYGRTHSGVHLPPLTPSQQPAAGPALIYPFLTFSNATSAALTVYLSSSENANPNSPNRYSFSIDDGAVTTVQPTPLGNAGGEPAGWSQAVVSNAWVKTSKIGNGNLGAGAHVLKVWLLEPTMVLTKLVVDVGGLKASELGPPESFRV